jgi:predicted nucleic acid-binding protein
MKPNSVVDSSPLIALEKVGHLALLPALFTAVYAPPAVVAEFGQSPEWLQVIPPTNTLLVQVLREELDKGESEAITLATELNECEVVLDDLRARRKAERLGLSVIGVVGLLVRAKQRRLIEQIQPLLDELRSQGFYISDALYEQALTLAQE